ncbi:MAG: hypothetical protein J5589_01725 [Firmicutes bacterium]|nr:hypothetical protein [Bacillota bacterium]
MTPIGLFVGQWLHHLIQFLLLIYLTGQLYLMILSFRLHRTKRVYVPMAILFLLGFVVLTILSDRSYVFDKQPNQLVDLLYRIPWAVYLAFVMILFIYLFLAFLNARAYMRSHLTEASIKETIDLLPAGILIAQPDGTVQMSNVQMNDLCEELTGETLSDARRFWVSVATAGEVSEGHVLIRSEEDDDVIMFSRDLLSIEKQEYVQMLATDVTERFQAIEDIREKNAQLREYQNRMKNYQQLAAQTIRSEEILNARRIVHDQVGHALLTARYYLEHPENVDAAALLEMLRQTNQFLLREAEEAEEPEDPIEEAAGLAQAIGVRISSQGSFPSEERARKLIGYAIRECAANTAKHGHGDVLYVTIMPLENGAGGWKVRLENNGLPADGPVRESGGLLNLRRMASDMSATMQVETKSAFAVELTIPGLK